MLLRLYRRISFIRRRINNFYSALNNLQLFSGLFFINFSRMSTILCIETATTVCSAAIGRAGKLISLRETNAGYTHSENLTLFIDQVCKESGVDLQSLDAIAVSRGPGSYTGLRIGASTAKGLCYALQKPLIAIDTLKILASCFLQEQKIKADDVLVPMIDARRMEVYSAAYDGELNELSAAQSVIVDENSFRQFSGKKIFFFGDGAAKCRTFLEEHLHATFAETQLSAKGMLILAEKKFSNNEFEDVSLFEPFYLKEPFIGTQKI